MDLSVIDGKLVAYFLAFLLTLSILNTCYYGYYINTKYPDEYMPMGSVRDFSIARISRYLQGNGWVDERVDSEELEYVCQLATHLSIYYDNVSPELALAVIAQESKFYRYDKYEGALGLMQLLPSYHRERLIACIEDDERYVDELFFDPRLNIMTGLDYLSQLIDECDNDISYALMCYNQGPSSAYRTYIKNGITSDYANAITKLSEELSSIASGG